MQVAWPESKLAQQNPSAWNLMAVDAETTKGVENLPPAWRTANDQLCMLLGAGAVGILALAVSAAWLYTGS